MNLNIFGTVNGVWLGNLDLDLKAGKNILGFPFFPFYCEIRKRISNWALLKTCSFARPNAISEKGPNKLGFKNETVKKKNPSNLDEDFFIEIHLKSVFRFWVLLHNPQSVLQINPDLLIGIILYFAQERASGRFWSTGVCFQTIAFWAIDYVVLHVSYPLFYLFCFCCYCFDCIERATIMDVITIMSIFCLKRHLKRIRKSYKISV